MLIMLLTNDDRHAAKVKEAFKKVGQETRTAAPEYVTAEIKKRRPDAVIIIGFLEGWEDVTRKINAEHIPVFLSVEKHSLKLHKKLAAAGGKLLVGPEPDDIVPDVAAFLKSGRQAALERPDEVRFSSRVLVVCSPWTPGAGVTSLVVATARALEARGEPVCVVDCDFKNPQLAERFGFSPDEVWRNDWRQGRPHLEAGDYINCFVLDRTGETPPDAALNAVLEEAGRLSGRVIVDAGDNPELDACGDRLLVVDTNLLTEDVLKAWEFYRPFEGGAVLLKGKGKNPFQKPLLGQFSHEATEKQVSAILKSWEA